VIAKDIGQVRDLMPAGSQPAVYPTIEDALRAVRSDSEGSDPAQ
jgi:hypothetical protein